MSISRQRYSAIYHNLVRHDFACLSKGETRQQSTKKYQCYNVKGVSLQK